MKPWYTLPSDDSFYVSIRPAERPIALPLATREVGMGRNYFLQRREEEIQLATLASCEAARQAHSGLAGLFQEAAEKDYSPRSVAPERQRT